MGKGDSYRKVNQDKFNQNFDRIFNKRGNKMSVDNERIIEERYQSAVDDITSMTVDQFETLCEEEGIKDIVPNIDEAIDIIATRQANGERS
tara:strand:- start:302 stop:574 length:273 start_codon:yes stop_codon:yes gene_type:complete